MTIQHFSPTGTSPALCGSTGNDGSETWVVGNHFQGMNCNSCQEAWDNLMTQQKSARDILVPRVEHWTRMYQRGFLSLAEYSQELQTEILKAAAATGADY